MTLKEFDLSTIRRNWERSAATLPIHSPDRLAFVRPPPDVYAAGAQLLERLRHELRDAFPANQAALAPFLRRVESCFEALRAAAREGEADAANICALREELAAAFCDLEDICEAFLGSPR